MNFTAPTIFIQKYKSLLLGVGLVLCALNVTKSVRINLDSELIYLKDFVQQYVMAEALVKGLAFHMPAHELREIVVGDGFENFRHPSPHPPLVSLLFAPLLTYDYQLSCHLWLAFQILLLFGVSKLVAVEAGGTQKHAFYLFVLLLSSSVVAKELYLGNLNLPKLYCELLALKMFLSSRHYSSGVFLALSFLIKLGGWSLGLLFLMNQKFKTLLIAGIVVCTFYGLLEVVQESFVAQNFFLETIPSVSSIYIASPGNISLGSLTYKILEGVALGNGEGLLAQPKISALLSKVVVIIGLAVTALCLFRVEDKFLRGLIFISFPCFFNLIAWWTTLTPALLVLGYIVLKYQVRKVPILWVCSLLVLQFFNFWYDFIIAPFEFSQTFVKDIALYSYFMTAAAALYLIFASAKLGKSAK